MPASLKASELVTCVRQVRTALADTPGLLYVTKCESLLAEQQFAELLDELVKHFDLLFSKDSDRGAALLHVYCTCIRCKRCFAVNLQGQPFAILMPD